MRILVVADEECKALWDYYREGRLAGLDLILSCGDLQASYLSFLATFAPCPVLYVHGNHDDSYQQRPPEGCICIDGKLYEHQGVRIVGLGGSMRYKMGINQYTDIQMACRAAGLLPHIWMKKGFDILLTHAPGAEMVECTDLAHQGFWAFNRLLDKYQPALFLHGHTHMNYGRGIQRERMYGKTRVINGYERYVVET